MSRLQALLLVSVLLPACGQPALPTLRLAAPVAAVAGAETEETSVRATVRDTITRYLARKNANMTIEKLYIAKSAQNGMQLFSARCTSPRQVRRIEGRYDVTKRIAMVESDTLLP